MKILFLGASSEIALKLSNKLNYDIYGITRRNSKHNYKKLVKIKKYSKREIENATNTDLDDHCHQSAELMPSQSVINHDRHRAEARGRRKSACKNQWFELCFVRLFIVSLVSCVCLPSKPTMYPIPSRPVLLRSPKMSSTPRHQLCRHYRK